MSLKALFAALLCLLANACTPTPSTDHPITNAGPVLALLGVTSPTEVYAVPDDPTCNASQYPGFAILARDPGTGACFAGLTIGNQVWLVTADWLTFSASSIVHESRHLLDHDHPGAYDWAPDSEDGKAIAAGRAMLAARPDLNTIQVAK